MSDTQIDQQIRREVDALQQKRLAWHVNKDELMPIIIKLDSLGGEYSVDISGTSFSINSYERSTEDMERLLEILREAGYKTEIVDPPSRYRYWTFRHTSDPGCIMISLYLTIKEEPPVSIPSDVPTDSTLVDDDIPF